MLDMKKCLFIFVVLCGLSLSLQAQPPQTQKRGVTAAVGVSDALMIDQLMFIVEGVGDSREALRRQNVKPYMMPVRKTGRRGNDFSYVLAACLEYYINLGQNYKENLSPDYISLNLTAGQQPLTPTEAFLFLAREGTVSAAIMPYDTDAPSNAIYAAKKYKINHYLQVFRDRTDERQRTFEARKALMRGHPVIVELMVDESLRQETSSMLHPKAGQERVPLLVVGFDEDLGAFEVMGAWGTAWGSNGYGFIRYSDFGKFALNGYVMVMAQP